MLDELEALIRARQVQPHPDSYTAELFQAGRGRIAQKVGEEAVELLVAALSQNRQQQLDELADLVYHLLVLMAELGLTLEDLRECLSERHRASRS